ncbi:MAG: hypothetical protein ABIH35_01135 [Patescibacteria group bacterium]
MLKKKDLQFLVLVAVVIGILILIFSLGNSKPADLQSNIADILSTSPEGRGHECQINTDCPSNEWCYATQEFSYCKGRQ